ncbi:MAG TPA: hypothetical protein VF765_31040 [Polyangiaceae bacterium]
MRKLFPIIALAVACACTPAESQVVVSDAELAAKDAVSCVVKHTDVFATPGAAKRLLALCGPYVTEDVAASTMTAFYQAKTNAGGGGRVTLTAEAGAP